MFKLRFIIFTLVCTALVLPSAKVAAQPADRMQAQIEAATANAVVSLRGEISNARITPTLTVARFLEQTDSVNVLGEIVQRAQQIGGPRWVDDQTCQVKLEVSGARVAYALVSVAAVRPALSPLSAAALEQRLKDWKDRSFTATGMSVSAERTPTLRPLDVGPRWLSVTDDARTEAVAAAKQDAAQHLLNNIGPIEFGQGRTMGDLTSREPVQQAVRNWVATRPVTRIRYEDNLEVELTVSTPSDDLLQTVIDSARTLPGSGLPNDDKSLEQLKRDFARHVSAAIGRANVNSDRAVLPRPAIELPAQPPMWISRPIDAEGVSPRLQSALRTKTAAETVATENLRAKIGSLNLSRELTINEAVRQDARLGEAVNRALLRARVYKVDYRTDGGVIVRMTIDARDLWDEFKQAAR